MSRLLLQGGSMGLFLVLGWLFPRVEGKAALPRESWLNLLNGALLFAFALAVIKPLQAHAELGLLDMSWLSWPVAQFLVSLVLLDFARYWLHYAHHRVPILWKFHRVHHCAEYIDSTTGLRMHLVDFVQLAALPVLLFGVLLDISSFAPWVLPAALGVGVVFDAFEHSNLRMNSRSKVFKVWDILLNSPHFHSWHHTREGKKYDGNYGNTFVIWDRMFGTEVTREDPPEEYGIVEWDTLEESVLGWWLLRPRDPDAVKPAAYGGPADPEVAATK